MFSENVVRADMSTHLPGSSYTVTNLGNQLLDIFLTDGTSEQLLPGVGNAATLLGSQISNYISNLVSIGAVSITAEGSPVLPPTPTPPTPNQPSPTSGCMLTVCRRLLAWGILLPGFPRFLGASPLPALLAHRDPQVPRVLRV